jgi:hypothetical protein
LSAQAGSHAKIVPIAPGYQNTVFMSQTLYEAAKLAVDDCAEKVRNVAVNGCRHEVSPFGLTVVGRGRTVGRSQGMPTPKF